jgi:hypothetical protein
MALVQSILLSSLLQLKFLRLFSGVCPYKFNSSACILFARLLAAPTDGDIIWQHD